MVTFPQQYIDPINGKTTKLDPLGKERLLKLADFLEGLKPEEFYFGNVRQENSCGAVGCAVGWMPNVFPEDWHTHVSVSGRVCGVEMDDGGEDGSFYDAANYFGIVYDDCVAIFDLSSRYSKRGFEDYEDVRAWHVAEEIRTFIKELE